MSLLPPVSRWRPICRRKRPSRVNFSSTWSLGPFPAIQTLSWWSTWMPCSFSGQLGWCPGPPQACTRFPSGSNSSTEGAGTQQAERGGLKVAPRSSSVMERGRWTTQTWSRASVATPAACPISQRFGNGFGQNGIDLVLRHRARRRLVRHGRRRQRGPGRGQRRRRAGLVWRGAWRRFLPLQRRSPLNSKSSTARPGHARRRRAIARQAARDHAASGVSSGPPSAICSLRQLRSPSRVRRSDLPFIRRIAGAISP